MQARELVIAEVETAQHGKPGLLPVGHKVEDFFHPGGEVEIDQVAEVVFEQADHRKTQPGGDQRGTPFHHVAPVLNGGDDAGIRGGSADSAFFQGFHQAGLGVARGRFGFVAGGGDVCEIDDVALGQHRQSGSAGGTVVLLVGAFLVGGQEAREQHDGAGGAEFGVPGVGGVRAQAHGRGGFFRIRHLRRHGAPPHELVQGEVVTGEFAGDFPRGAEVVPGGSDRFVGLLRVLRFALVDPRRRRHVGLAE